MEVSQALAALAALAQKRRLSAFRLLVEAGPEGLPAGEIAARLGLAPATLSFHLSQLERAELVNARRRGRRIIYAANFAQTRALMSFLSENCCGGDMAACAGPPAPPATEPDLPRRRTPAA